MAQSRHLIARHYRICPIGKDRMVANGINVVPRAPGANAMVIHMIPASNMQSLRAGTLKDGSLDCGRDDVLHFCLLLAERVAGVNLRQSEQSGQFDN
jgi:hypothetical protein